MLKAADNALLTSTNAGTPLGELFRRYWIPVVNSRELVADGAPVRVRLLGEDLIAFRDSEGRVGLVDEKCPHRRTSLAVGLNAGCGITCIYHGWKFDVTGRCVDLPSEPKDSKLKDKVRLKSYPVREVKGIVWGYLGSPDNMPPFPDFYWMHLPDDHVISERVWQECNYLQVMENDIDYVHAAFLHRAHQEQKLDDGLISSDLGISPSHPLVKNPPVKQAVESTKYGKRCIGVGEADENRYAFMEIHYIFPFYTFPPRMKGEDGMWHAFIPRDDYSTWSWDVQFSHSRPINAEGQRARRGILLDKDMRKLRNRSNNYEQDRSLMIDGNYSGIRGIANQDHAVTELMGPIVDRSLEVLGTSDLPIIQVRRMLLEQVKAFREGNRELQHDQYPLRELYSCGVIDDKNKHWSEALPLNPAFAVNEEGRKKFDLTVET